MSRPNDLIPGEMPRRDLREPAFRRFESVINRALHESFSIDPRIEYCMNADTFIKRFHDAILGFQRYGYASILLKRVTDFSGLKLRAMTDGSVFIENRNAVRVRTEPRIYVLPQDDEALTAEATDIYRNPKRDMDQVFFRAETEAIANAWIAKMNDEVGMDNIRKEGPPGCYVARR